MSNNPRLNKGFGQVSSAVMRDPDISFREKGLYAYLSTYTNASTNQCTVSVHKMASECGVNESTISRILKSLEQKGIIKRTDRGSTTSHITTLLK